MINWQLSKQGIRWPVSLDSIAGSGVDPSRSSIFWSCPLTSFRFSIDRRIRFIFFKFIWNMFCLCAAQLKLILDAKIQPAITGREDSCFWLCSPRSRVGRALRPIFMLSLVKIWQGSLCGKLWQLKLTEFCMNLNSRFFCVLTKVRLSMDLTDKKRIKLTEGTAL